MLRRHFGISAHQAEHEIPVWEIDVLLGQLLRDLRSHGDG